MNISKNALTAIGIAGIVIAGSAGIMAAKVLTASKAVNIFSQTRNECPGIKWMDTVEADNIHAPLHVEGELYFAGERVPLEDPDVRERLDRELIINCNWHSNTLLCMKMANRYFPEIEKTLTENGVPTDFKYLALIESTFRLEPSPAGAAGFWQFLKSTAPKYGMQVDEQVDERYNVEKATRGACQFLKDAKEKLGSWTLAAASYNMGLQGALDRSREQKQSNYYDMYFNPETSRYVFRILALKIIFSNPQKAGFAIKPEDLYQPYQYKTVEVDTSINSVADFAAQFGLKYKHIKILNPWLRDTRLTNKEHKAYQIRIMTAS